MTFYTRTSKYSGWYFAIIKRARATPRSKKEGYFENHHIHPECFGGKKTKDNMVLLTAREHIVCHRLLIRMFEPKSMQWTSMVFAFKRMIDCGSKHQGERQSVVKTRHLEERRRLHGLAMSIRMTGRKMPEHVKKIISDSNTGRILTEDHKAAIGATLKETLSTPEQKTKMSVERQSRIHSEQRKMRTAESMTRVWAERNAAKGPKPDVLPGRNSPEEKKMLQKHLLSVRQKGKGPRYIPSAVQCDARSKSMQRVWAERRSQKT
jgi:hypothetical protein